MPPYNHHHGNNRPPRVLNVAEKPSVARSLAQAFERMPGSRQAANGPRHGSSSNNAAQLFTHENVTFPYIFSQGSGQRVTTGLVPARPHTMITTSVRGHLASIDFAPGYGWNQCDTRTLFEAPLQTYYDDDNKPLQQMLLRLARDADAVILWLDCDREGEAIGDEVIQVCLQGNPRLQSPGQQGNANVPSNKIFRAKFSTVLFQEIERALSSLGRNNDHLVHAVQARMELDLRVGAAFTRFQTLRLQRKFQYNNNGNNGGGGGGNNKNSVISYGPCQFPTLGFVVERWARIETFQSEDFWFLELTLQVGAANNENRNPNEPPNSSNNNNNNNRQPGERPIVFTWKRQRLFDRPLTLALYESCLDDGMAVVTQLSGRPKSKWRPVPLATVELQKRASRYLRIGSEVTMTAAEQLYQAGYISYPRTETERFRPEFQHLPLIQDFANLGAGGGGGGGDGGGWGNANATAQFAAYANKLLNDNGFQNPRAGQNDDQAHPPIAPAKVVDPSTLSDPTQRQIYILIVKHYLACCSRDATGRETTLTVKIASEEFNARGLMVEHKNWLEIYHPWERWSTGQGELPHLQVGSRIQPQSLLMKDGRTTPPQLISEVELISLMDRCGIGTDATIADHIKTIVVRNYASKNADQRFEPQPLGIALVEGYNSMGYQLNKPDLRRETEQECHQVARGQKTKDDIVGPILNKMKEIYEGSAREASKLDEAMDRRFSRRGAGNDAVTVQASFSECGTCRQMMALKEEPGNGGGGGGDFSQKLLYCSHCQEVHILPRKGQFRPKTEEENGITSNNTAKIVCPICNFQVVAVARGDGYDGNGYNVCPQCYNDPPPETGAVGDGASNMMCFKCCHPTCALAQGLPGENVEIFSCPFCTERRVPGGKVSLRKSTRGPFLGCSNYNNSRNKCNYTVWFPRGTQNVSVDEGDGNICTQCSTGGPVRKISFVWKSGGVPPHLGRESTECVLCNARFRQDVGISLPQLGQVQSRSTSSRVGGGGSGGRGGRDNGRRGGARPSGTNFNNVNTDNNRGSGGGFNNGNSTGNVCFRCSQPGHHANDCPNNGGGINNSSNNNNSTSGNYCFKCGQPGHYANDCPNNNGGVNTNRSSRSNNNSSSNGNSCYRCGQPGHYANACPNR